MTDETKDKAEVMWRMARMVIGQPVIVKLGTGEGMIGTGHADGVVNIAFFNKNGADQPMPIGGAIEGKRKKALLKKEKPAAIVSFSSRESLKVLEHMVAAGHAYFDEIEAGE
jgi:hypothetical protein